jgi:hypothetical protein
VLPSQSFYEPCHNCELRIACYWGQSADLDLIKAMPTEAYTETYDDCREGLVEYLPRKNN